MLRLLWIILLKTQKISNKRYWKILYQYLLSTGKNQKVIMKIHNQKMIMNYGFSYLLYARKYSTLNNPLIEAVYRTYLKRNKPITIIDVGAAIGDTVALLEANVPMAIHRMICIEGDPDFFQYLKANLKGKENIECVYSMLSDIDGSIDRTLIKTHPGTASAQSFGKSQSKKLDTVLSSLDLISIDLIKVDVDGFDGLVLAGARKCISQYKPTIIFEWHPKLIKETGNEVLFPFEICASEGYNSFVLFDKFGHFSQFHFFETLYSLENLANLCISEYVMTDHHYDVVALHKDSDINLFELAGTGFSRKCKSRF